MGKWYAWFRVNHVISQELPNYLSWYNYPCHVHEALYLLTTMYVYHYCNLWISGTLHCSFGCLRVVRCIFDLFWWGETFFHNWRNYMPGVAESKSYSFDLYNVGLTILCWYMYMHDTLLAIAYIHCALLLVVSKSLRTLHCGFGYFRVLVVWNIHASPIPTPLEISITDVVSFIHCIYLFLFLKKPLPHPQKIPIPYLGEKWLFL